MDLPKIMIEDLHVHVTKVVSLLVLTMRDPFRLNPNKLSQKHQKIAILLPAILPSYYMYMYQPTKSYQYSCYQSNNELVHF